jgi:hypothetical protein
MLLAAWYPVSNKSNEFIIVYEMATGFLQASILRHKFLTTIFKTYVTRVHYE